MAGARTLESKKGDIERAESTSSEAIAEAFDEEVCTCVCSVAAHSDQPSLAKRGLPDFCLSCTQRCTSNLSMS